MTLNDIWDKEIVALDIKEGFNICVINELEHMQDNESKAIERIIYKYCHVLRGQELKVDEQKASTYLSDIINHNIVELTIQVRQLLENIDYKTIGQNHMQTKVLPYDETDANLTSADTVSFSNLNSAIMSREFTKQKLPALQDIYKELKGLVFMVYEV